MSIIVKANSQNSLVNDQVSGFFGADYKEPESLYTRIATDYDSSFASERMVESDTFGNFGVKPEGAAGQKQSLQDGYTVDFNIQTYSNSYEISDEAVADNQEQGSILKIEKNNVKLSNAMVRTKDLLVSNVYNNAFSTAVAGGDGVPLLSSSHPTPVGNQANRLATSAEFSQTAIEELFNLISKAKDRRGNFVDLKVKALMVPTELRFQAMKILQTEKEVGSANNDINILSSSFDGNSMDLVVNPYLTSATKYYLITDNDQGVVYYNRDSGTLKTFNDDDKDSSHVKLTFRCATGFADWRGVFGSGE